jgi:hypothetical protein
MTIKTMTICFLVLTFTTLFNSEGKKIIGKNGTGGGGGVSKLG